MFGEVMRRTINGAIFWPTLYVSEVVNECINFPVNVICVNRFCSGLC